MKTHDLPRKNLPSFEVFLEGLEGKASESWSCSATERMNLGPAGLRFANFGEIPRIGIFDRNHSEFILIY